MMRCLVMLVALFGRACFVFRLGLRAESAEMSGGSVAAVWLVAPNRHRKSTMTKPVDDLHNKDRRALTDFQ